jgi:hypothetical protein
MGSPSWPDEPRGVFFLLLLPQVTDFILVYQNVSLIFQTANVNCFTNAVLKYLLNTSTVSTVLAVTIVRSVLASTDASF